MSGKIIKGYILVIMSAVIFGCMPLMTKYIYSDGANPISVVFLRNSISVPMLAVICILKGHSLKVNFKDALTVGLTGIMGCGITPLLLFSSYNFIASGTATVFHFIYPAIVVIAEVIFLKKKLRALNIISVLMCIAGLCFFAEPGGEINGFGSIIAILSGFAYAAYVVLLSAFSFKKLPGFVFGFYAATASALFMLAACVSTGNLMLPQSVGGWAVMILFALTVNVGAVIMFQAGTFIIGGQKASVLSAFEPITGVIIGALAFHELITLRSVTGTLLIVVAGIIISSSAEKH